MDGQGGPQCPLRRIFQGDGRPKKRHDAISGHLVDRPLVFVDLAYQYLVNLVHHAIGFHRADSIGKRCKPHHIAEQNRNLLALTFYFFSLIKDFFGEAVGKVLLNFL